MMRYQLRYVRVPPVFVGDEQTLPDGKIARQAAPPPPTRRWLHRSTAGY
ncbi:hypothetical protein [Micromonospora sp. CPCC 205561]